MSPQRIFQAKYVVSYRLCWIFSYSPTLYHWHFICRWKLMVDYHGESRENRVRAEKEMPYILHRHGCIERKTWHHILIFIMTYSKSFIIIFYPQPQQQLQWTRDTNKWMDASSGGGKKWRDIDSLHDVVEGFVNLIWVVVWAKKN